eukprot:TRINITY_DN1732_c0_g1_i1.p1 TRINITY_DN1732_c0_g1~~TRINITY_DN1732_c0_g1_i1.p1  ORF type:complete len:304 (+),score=-5.06 TRINITY_DN1732_c0_g1_i1:111-914(+)
MDTSSQMNLKSSHEEYPKLRLYLMEFMYHGGTLFYVIFCLFVNYKFLGDAKIPYFSDSFLRGVGIAFVLVALLIGIMSMWQVKIAARKKALVTNGFYSLTRNPAEGALIFFGMPGIALLTCRLLMLTAIFFQAWLFLKLIHALCNDLTIKYSSTICLQDIIILVTCRILLNSASYSKQLKLYFYILCLGCQTIKQCLYLRKKHSSSTILERNIGSIKPKFLDLFQRYLIFSFLCIEFDTLYLQYSMQWSQGLHEFNLLSLHVHFLRD